MHTKTTIANEKKKLKQTKNMKTKEITSRKEYFYLKMTKL
jgi:hypothetical protein